MLTNALSQVNTPEVVGTFLLEVLGAIGVTLLVLCGGYYLIRYIWRIIYWLITGDDGGEDEID